MDNGRLCDSGQYGTLEAYASAKSLVCRCHEALDAGRDSALNPKRSEGVEITPLVIGQAAEAGDDLADELVMDTARYLGVGSTTLMHTIDPDVVLFGGAMTFGREETELGRRFLERIRQEVRTRAFPVPAEKTRLEFASLGNDAGYIGAAGCARRDFLAK
jgi:glucokinase